MISKFNKYDGTSEFRGTSSDTKPTAPVAKNGDRFIEMDGGKNYLYDAESDSWEEQPKKGGGGGGGVVPIASGTFIGNGSNTIDIPVGKKMPQRDFLFRVWVDDGIEFEKNIDYVVIGLNADTLFAHYDLSSDGTKAPTSDYTLISNDAGALTTIRAHYDYRYLVYVRNGVTGISLNANAGYNRIKRDTDGFSVSVQNFSPQNQFVSGLTYNWKLVYVGTDPSNDIVEVA